MNGMETKLPDEIHQLGRLFASAGHEIRIVGGWVRDRLRRIEPKDLDLCTTARPEQMIGLCRANRVEYAETGLKHGTLTIIRNHRAYEVTTLRVDVETDGRHACVEFTNDWTQDAARRDFTINAMSMTLDGEVFDYFGGQQHLADQRVVFVGNAEQRIREDYLRVLRYFRFCDRIGDLHGYNEYHREIRQNASGLAGISGERIWLEMAKILSGRYVINQLAAMWAMRVTDHIGLPQVEPSDIYRAEAARKATDNPITILAALTPSAIAEPWRLSRQERVLLEFLQGCRDDRPTLDRLKDMATSGRYGRERATEWAALFGPSDELDAIRGWQVPEFPVRGADLIALGVPAGPVVGTKLAELEREWKGSGYKKRREELLASLT